MSNHLPGVPYGFEYDDIKQERALGRVMSEIRKPGDDFAAYRRGRMRAGLHKKKEREWNLFRRPLTETSKSFMDEETRLAQLYLHEILDLLPFGKKEEIKKILETGDGRNIKKAGREVREFLPPGFNA